MKFDVVTIFPEMVEAGLTAGVIGRARQRGLLDVVVHNLRDFTTDAHRVVDDVPFGGGPGMVLKPEPLFRAVETIVERRGPADAVVLMSPGATPFTQGDARRLARLDHVIVLCGRYEGVDDRVRQHLTTEELSIGDYVLSGGELPALVIIDAVGRLVPGVVGDEASVEGDSFMQGLLDYPHYTRPADFRGHRVPDVLLSGHHGEIARWRQREALQRTVRERPELLESATLNGVESALAREIDRVRDARSKKGSD
jgi:tRNA (guanine37-N1)-methyltransferase